MIGLKVVIGTKLLVRFLLEMVFDVGFGKFVVVVGGVNFIFGSRCGTSECQSGKRDKQCFFHGELQASKGQA